ncbi:transposase [Streptomyces brevispora]|uniref:transposase n=1 Tax=Streptomyces brevispora TaxID=887462 RepID=UPI002E31ED46|nr:transposase [Streptomyces brevispora]
MGADLSKRPVPDELGELVAPLLPSFVARPQAGGAAPRDERAVFTAVAYVLTSGCARRHLPPTFGTSSATAHRRFTIGTEVGLWRRLHRAVLDELGARGEADRTSAIVCAASVPATKGGPLTGRTRSVAASRAANRTCCPTRGPAVIPAWLFRLKGYAAPLERAAVTASELPRPPVKGAPDVPGFPLGRMVRMSADGRSVAVVALHGVCDKGPAVDVLETRGSVVLSASVKAPAEGGHCTKQGKLQEVTVRLGRSLGDRVLLDAHTGRPVFYRPPHGPSPSWS